MSINRTAPAYQEYAASIIARFEYRTMTMQQRGLLYAMRLECWVNQYLPESPSLLARMLGFDVEEVTAALPHVMAFFAVENGRIVAPDLEIYRERVVSIRSRQAEGGKAGAAKTNARKSALGSVISSGASNPASNLTGEPTSNPQVPRRVSSESVNTHSNPHSNPNPKTHPSQREDVGNYSYEGGDGWDFTRDPEDDGHE